MQYALGHESLEGEEEDHRQDERLDDRVEIAERATTHSSAVSDGDCPILRERGSHDPFL